MKQGNVALTVLMSFEPCDFNLPDDCSEEEFREKMDELTNEIIGQIEDATALIVNDIESEIIEK